MSNFIVDKQTLDDLNLLSRYRSNSVYSIFNKVQTNGGKKLLDDFFDCPLTDAVDINSRAEVFRYFGAQEISFPFTAAQFEVIEDYLGSAEGKDKFDLLRVKSMAVMGIDKEYNFIKDGFQSSVKGLNAFRSFLMQLNAVAMPEWFADLCREALLIFDDSRLDWLRHFDAQPMVNQTQLVRYDSVLRYSMQKEVKQICELIYRVDVFIAVAQVAKARGFTYPLALAAGQRVMQIDGLFHPELKHAVGNDISMAEDANVIFLTGANMAGKSTTMKAFGIAVYLAHMGFPVAAHTMKFSVRDGIYTSINVPDNLNLGYSHFYAEVLRVKAVAELVSANKNMVVIFDELFKGTNVKDAYDATLAVTSAFSAYRNCVFIISTHIIEVGDELRKDHGHIQFLYLPTIMKGTKPTYTYQLLQGITEDRHGMMIINNENILEMIKGTI